MVVVDLGNRMPNLVPLEVVLSVLFVVELEFFVVLVRFKTKRMMKSQKTMKRKVVSSCSVVVHHQVLHEHAGSWTLDFGNQMPNLIPLSVVCHCQMFPLEVVRQLAYGWQFVLQQR